MIRSSSSLILVLSILLLSACAASPQPPAAPPTYAWPQPSALPPQETPWPSALPAPQSANSAPIFSPTPQTHLVAAGETLSLLAQRYGLSLDAVMAANPGIDPQALTIGQRIFLPAPSGAEAWLPTPLPLTVAPLRCFEQLEGAWCLAEVTNPSGEGAALLSGEISLFDSEDHLLARLPALSLLENLPAGASLPLAAFFSPFPKNTAAGRLSLQTAFDAPLPASPQVRGLLVQVSLEGRSASAQGRVFLPENAPLLSRVWLVALGYDRQGRLCAFRRVELSQPLQPGESLPFGLEVYSLGPALWRVQVYAEGH